MSSGNRGAVIFGELQCRCEVFAWWDQHTQKPSFLVRGEGAELTPLPSLTVLAPELLSCLCLLIWILSSLL